MRSHDLAGRALHHVALGSPEPERAAAFYRALFDLPEIARHHESSGRVRSVWLDMAGVILMVERTDDEGTRVEGVGQGAFLLAFAVEPGACSDMEERLVALGGRVESRTDFTCYCRDPEGNRLAFSHYAHPHKS